jgi:hypothetical protein
MCKHEIALRLDHAATKGEARRNSKYAIELLNDAVDAIEIGHPDIALKRIKFTIKQLKQILKELD